MHCPVLVRSAQEVAIFAYMHAWGRYTFYALPSFNLQEHMSDTYSISYISKLVILEYQHFFKIIADILDARSHYIPFLSDYISHHVSLLLDFPIYQDPSETRLLAGLY